MVIRVLRTQRTKSKTRIIRNVRFIQCLTCGRPVRVLSDKHRGYCRKCYDKRYAMERRMIADARWNTIKKLREERSMLTASTLMHMSGDKFYRNIDAILSGKKQIVRSY